jgi:hypothetical protein
MSRRFPPRQRITRVLHLDAGLALAIALGLLAALPFLTRPGLPRGTDAELHVFRAAELGYSLQAGDLYPRWAPDFYYGYGYPIFNYYAPLTYYLANLFRLAPGVDIVAGVKLVFILGLVCASAGTYLFARDSIGPRAGIIAAALYAFSPYVILVDPHMRGVLAESFSLGLFPMVLWAYSRVLREPRRRWFVAGAFLQSALIMSHNLLGAVCTGIVAAYLMWQIGFRAWEGRRQMPWREAMLRQRPALARVMAVFALGLGLSGIFWLPMIAERGDVALNLTGPGHFDFHNHFVSLGELLSPSPILDLGATAPAYGLNLGLPQWPLALLAIPALLWGTVRQRRLAGFFLVSSICLVILMLQASAPIWDVIPGMGFLQFPWRLLGPAAATLSIAAGAGSGALIDFVFRNRREAQREKWGAVLVGIVVAVTLFLALPAVYPPLWTPDFGPTDPTAMIEFELTGIAVGTTSTGDYLPVTVEIQPHPELVFVSTFNRPEGIDKVNRATLPRDTIVETVSHGPTHDRFHTQSSKPFILRLFTFYFPGWQAKIDGEQVPIELGRPEGFINVQVPPGIHTVELLLGALSTPARALGWAISLLSAAAVLCISWTGWQAFRAHLDLGDDVYLGAQSETRLDQTATWVLGAVVLVFVLFKVAVVDRQHDWFRRTSPPGEVIGAETSLSEAPPSFGHSIQLLGYDLPEKEAEAGATLPLTLYWRATGPVSENYQVFAHLTQPSTHLWGQSDKLNPGDIPSQRWPTNKYVRDAHELAILPGTPPGDYQISIGLYNLANGVRVPVFDSVGALLGETFALDGPVHIIRPGRPPEPDALEMTDKLDIVYSDQITLLGADVSDRQIEVPGFIHLALLWRAEVDAPRDITVRVQLVDSAGEAVDEIVSAPVDGRYPASRWSSGEIVRDQYSFWLADGFPPGIYQLRVGLDGYDGIHSLGSIEVPRP